MERMAYDDREIIADLNRLTAGIKGIDVFQIQGGEPLIYKNLDKIIQYAGKNRKIKKITITTNSTVLPDRKIINLLKKYDVSMQLSSYPVTAGRREELSKLLEREKINFQVYDFLGGKGGGKWRAMGFMVPREKNSEIVRKRYASCVFAGCTTLENGVIGRCSRSTNAPSVQNYDPVRGELFDVRKKHLKIRFLWWYLIQPRLFPKQCMECCRRCLGSAQGEEVEPAVQL